MPNSQRPRLVFGTMRMVAKGWSIQQWDEFFDELYSLGIEALHVSPEYDSYSLLCSVLAYRREANKPSFAIVLKLADPSFDDAGFDAARFESKIDGYCRELGESFLEAVQWMWRADLKDDARRIEAFVAQSPMIADSVSLLRTRQKVGRFLCFPYSTAFAEAAIAAPWVDGLTVYRNVVEREYDDVSKVAKAAGKHIVAIRPFGAGNLFAQGYGAAQLMQYVAGCPSVSDIIVTATERHHLEEIRDCFND